MEFSGFFVQVPNLVGRQRDEVIKSLQELDLGVKVREVEASSVGFREVVSIEPVPGAWIRRGSEVRVEFSDFSCRFRTLWAGRETKWSRAFRSGIWR